MLSDNLGDIVDVSELPDGDTLIEAESDIFGNEVDWEFILSPSLVDGPGGDPDEGRGGEPETPSVAFLSMAYTLTNNSTETSDFSVLAQAAFVGPGGVLPYEGSVSGSVGDGDGSGESATVAALPGGSLYTAVINGADDESALNFPTSASAPQFETVPFGPGNVTGELNTPAASIGIRNEFQLTDGDFVTFTNTLAVLPTPGALGLLGVAGLAATRRHRNSA
jgi:hypothetical protein